MPRFHYSGFVLLAGLIGACGSQSDPTGTPNGGFSDAVISGTAGAVSANYHTDTVATLVGPAHIRGNAVLIRSSVPTNSLGRDTLRVTPLAGATVTLYRPEQQGTATPSLVLVEQVHSATDGTFSFAEVPSGYYIVAAEAPGSDGARRSLAYIMTTAHDILVTVRFSTAP